MNLFYVMNIIIMVVQQTGINEKEGVLFRHPHFNLNLIVDRPDGLIKEGKNLL